MCADESLRCTGLAQAACHPAQPKTLIPASLFRGELEPSSTILSHVSSLLHSLTLNKPKKLSELHGGPAHAASTSKSQPDVHAFTILARILQDSRFSYSALGLPLPEDSEESPFDRIEAKVGEALLDYALKWNVNGTNPAEIEEKIEELAWMSTLVYGVGGWSGRERSENGEFLADFLL